jgi:hypothetical protein
MEIGDKGENTVYAMLGLFMLMDVVQKPTLQSKFFYEVSPIKNRLWWHLKLIC